MSGEAARRYHEATKHTWESVRRGGRVLDYAARPHPFKEYPIDAEPVPAELDRLLKLAAGVVRTRSFAHGTYHFRTFSSAGALYPVELYVATRDGLFHYHPLGHELRRLRPEDVRGVLAQAAADEELARAGAVLVLTGILWRTAWKYGARGYRHVWWDAGTLLANLLWLEPQARLVTAFVDAKIDEVVGADGRREFAVALVALGETDFVAQSHNLPPVAQELPAFPGEEPFPLVFELNEKSRLVDAAAVRRQREASPPQSPPAPPEQLETALRRRVSVREFAPSPLPRDELASLCATVMTAINSDAPSLTRLTLIANDVDGLDQAAFDFDPPDGFRLVRPQTPRALAYRLTLEQELGGRAAAVAWLLADLEHLLAERGDRGYREAQLEAGIRAGRAQVGAFARGWGATASTFYDDEVREAFAATDEPMLCFAVGKRGD